MRKLYDRLFTAKRFTSFFGLIALLAINTAANAQANSANYTFTTDVTGSLSLAMNGTAIDMSTGTTQLVAANADASASTVTTIPFDFGFMGNIFNQFSANDDGIVQLGGTAIGTNIYTITGGTLTLPRLSAFNADLRVGAGGKVHYKVVGAAPNRVLVVEFLNMQLFYTGTAPYSNDATFQLRLYETTGVVEYVYGTMAASSIASTNRSPSVGFYTGSATGSFAAITYSSHSVSTTSPYAANPAVAATGPITDLTSASDGNRRYYRFTPATPASPTALTFSGVGLTQMTLNWNDNSSDEMGFVIYRSTDGVNYTLVATTAANVTSYIASGLTAGTLYYWRVFSASEGTISAASANGSQTTLTPSPMSGTYTINNTQPTAGTNFNNFTDAFDAVNGNGLTGALTFNVFANQTFNEILQPLTATGTAANTITFKKFGTGANPVVLRSDAGTLTTSTMGGQGDAVIIIQGGDYITFDQIDVNATDQGIEYGYMLRKASATDGCKNVTIKNANITLTKGSSVYVTGIYSSNLVLSSTVSSAAGVTVTSTGGRHENVTITGNTISNVFYGIQLRGFAHTTSPYDFYDQNFVVGASGAGNKNVISNFGGQSTTAVYGIYVIQHNATSVNYNTINNIDNGGSNSTGSMFGIYFVTGTTSSAIANNNNINLTSQYASGALYGIYNASFTGNLTVNSDTVSLNNTAASSGTFGFVYNGSATAATEVSLSNNVFAASTFNTTGTTYLIYNSVTNAATVTVQNNKTVGTIQKDGNSTMYGYYSAASPTGVENFYNNNFSDITAGGTSSFYGYYSNTAAAHRRNVYSNIVSNINAGGTTVAGIWKGIGGSNIYSNKVWNLTSTNTGTTTSVSGIFLNSGTKDSIYNNIIGDLFATGAANPTNSVVGIQSASSSTTSTIGIYYNTINLNASSSGANFGTSGISLTGSTTATTAAVEMKNNIIVNNSTPNGTGYTAVLRRITSSSLANLATSTNNNLLFTNSPGGNTALYFYDATIVDYTLQDFKNRITPRGTASISENPNFVSVVGTDPTYLHINTTIATQIESGGSPVGGITTDFDGDVRNATKPDIGADEFTGIAADLTGPSISYTPLGNTICTDQRTITATITDASGVNVAAGTKPRLWYKKATSNNVLPATNTSASNGWKWVEATNSSSPFTFTFDHNLLNSPIAANDSISYFIVAQDLASTPNVGANVAIFSNTPATVALSAASFPATGNIAGFRILSTPTPLLIKSDKASICASGSVTLDLDMVDATGGTYQWQSSPAGTNTWTNLTGGTTIPFTTPVISASTDFRLVVTCGGTPIATSPSNTVSVTVNNPQIIGTTPGTRCGPGTVNLAATAPGYDIKWYANASGGAALYTGSPFTTPSINATTTYYVAAATPGSGPATNAVGAGATTSATYPNPFYSLWSNTHNQYLILASELLASGITAGDITALAVNITSAGTLPVIDLSVKLGQTSATDMSAFVSPAFTTVFTSASLMPVTGLNTMSFTTPFTWDGTSNLVIEVCHGNPTSGATMSRTALADNTSFVSTIHTHTSAGTGASVQCGNLTNNLTTYSIRPQFTITYIAGCTGTRTAVTATVNTPPAITGPTATPSSVCAGQSSTLATSSTNTGYTYTWTPGSLTGASVSVTPAASTKYYVNAVDNSGGAFNGCVNKDSVLVTVNPVPSAIAITPASASLCSTTDPAQLLTASGGTLGGTLIFGTQANQNSASTTAAGYPSPFSNYYGGSRHQFLVLASDLSGAGFTAGVPITSINFPVVSLGSTFTNCQNFKVKVGHSTNTTMTTFVAGLTTVYGPSTFTPTVGYNNQLVFTTPFVWNGTDNLIIETTFSNANTGAASDVVVMYNSPTSYQSSIVYRVDGATAATVEAATAVSFSYSAMPDFTLQATQNTSITWSPVTGLYTNAAATTPYTGGISATVYAKPTATTTYTATATSAANCTNTKTVTITSNCPVPVTLVSFAGEKQGSVNKLMWTTSIEVNNAGFELERSADGKNFSKLAFVVSKADGNSNQTLNYVYYDERPLMGNGYYRLKQVDKDGKFTYSNIVLLKGDKVKEVMITSIYPNPAESELNLVITSPTSEKVTLVVTDITGKVISQVNLQLLVGDNLQKLPVSHLASGTYFVKTVCINGCESAVQKFMKK